MERGALIMASNNSGNTINLFFKMFGHLIDIVSADGKKRVKYVFSNLLMIAAALGIAFGGMWLFQVSRSFFYELHIVVSIIVIILGFSLIVAAIYFAIMGVLGSIVLLFVSFVGIFKAGQRGYNFLAFLLTLLTLGGIAWLLLSALNGSLIETVFGMLDGIVGGAQ